MASVHVHQHDEHIPDQTTPQGTQEAGVETGHEAHDLNFPVVFRWFIGLVLFAAASQVLLMSAVYFWNRHAEATDRLPSPLFGARQVPPEPRVLPNPADSPG